MSETSPPPHFFQELMTELKQLWHTFQDEWHSLGVNLRNIFRQIRSVNIDYVVLPIQGTLPERAEPPRSFIERQLRLPPPPTSLEQINNVFQRIADADNVSGVLLVLGPLAAGLGSLQNMRQAIFRLQTSGKEVVVFTPYLDTAHYFLAAAADKIIIPPGTNFEVIGLRSETIFLKDALARVGIQADAVQISPYKTGPNFLSKSEITPEQEAQMEWLLEETFDMITAAMAEGRRMTQAEFQHLVDQAPLFAADALAAALVDAVSYEDELPSLLAARPDEVTPRTEEVVPPLAADGEIESGPTGAETETVTPESNAEKENNNSQAKLMIWRDARSILLEKSRRQAPKFIGVISLRGPINMGPSQRPPIDLPIPFIGGESAGETTLVAQLRAAEKLDKMAALIFHVDSPGGSGLASDLIGREVERLGLKIPIVVYMGNVAASGGYYVSAAADHIMSQDVTITGSIGVWMVRLNTGELYRKLSINRTGINRGKRAGLYNDMAPMTEDEYQVFWDGITETYRQFKEVVAHGRDIPFAELDPICEGRVWSGRQALAHRLVDSHGDFVTAVEKAAELAGLPSSAADHIPVINLQPKGNQTMLPKPYEAAGIIADILSGEMIKSWHGKPLYLLPFDIHFH